MKRKQTGEVLVALEIPLDLQIEILKRLPVKSMARFKCVSKLWSSLIHSQGYIFPSPPRLYIKLEQAPEKYALLSLTSTSKSTAFDLDMMIDDGIEGYLIVALRGLILYNFFLQAYIYNPTTGQRVTLPRTINILGEEEYMAPSYYFLGYDLVFDQYKVLVTAQIRPVELQRTYTVHWIFVLETGGSWKRIEFDHPYFPLKEGLCINGVIYYLARSYVSGDIIISFNVRYEEFNTIELPHAMSANLIEDDMELIEYGGKPTIFDYTHLQDPSSLLNLWVLEDDGTWSNKSLVLKPCHKHFFPSSIFFSVIGTTQNDEVVLKPDEMSYPYYILYYDLYNNDVRRVDIRGISEEPSDLVLLDMCENIMHLKI